MGRWYDISIGSGSNKVSYTAPEGDANGAPHAEPAA